MSAAANLHPGMESMRIRLAKDADAEPLTRLINAAFRVEQPFIEGDRINPEGVRAYMKKGEFLLAEDSSGLVGCAYVEVRGDSGYLGLLGVEPKRQGAGLGRKLMDAAENNLRLTQERTYESKYRTSSTADCGPRPCAIRRSRHRRRAASLRLLRRIFSCRTPVGGEAPHHSEHRQPPSVHATALGAPAQHRLTLRQRQRRMDRREIQRIRSRYAHRAI